MQRFEYVLTTIMAVFALSSVGLAQPWAPPPKPIPADAITKIHNFIQTPQFKVTSREQYEQKMFEQLGKALELGEQTLNDYPDARNASTVRSAMLTAAEIRNRLRPSKETKETVVRIAQDILDSNAPAAFKMEADTIITREKLVLADGTLSKDAEKEIRQFIQRHGKGRLKGQAVAYGSMLADNAKMNELYEELVEDLELLHSDDPIIITYLISIDRGPVFKAELTRLDGTKLTLPDDLKGKIVIVDFWATWCSPCIKAIPHLKQIYAKYKDKGVEIVGISLDEPNSKGTIEDFIQKREITWIHTYSGKKWSDPTVKKYGVTGIPSIWVLDQNGKIRFKGMDNGLELIINDLLEDQEKEKEKKDK